MATKKNVLNDTKQTTEKNECTQYIYVGPSLPSGKLQSNTVFKGNFKKIVDMLSGIIDEIPQIKNLIIPINKLSEYEKKLNRKDNIISKYYSDIVSHFKN